MYLEAFKRLVSTPRVSVGMEILCTTLWLQKEREIIETIEHELLRIKQYQAPDYATAAVTAAATAAAASARVSWWTWIRSFFSKPAQVDSVLDERERMLLRELAVSQGKCAKFEARKAAALKKKAEYEKGAAGSK